MNFYIFIIVIFSIISIYLTFLNKDDFNIKLSLKAQKLQKKYCIVYLLYKMSEWLQGPYFYQVYSEYLNLSSSEIVFYFLAGFISSMIIGTFIGTYMDKIGRKNGIIIYGITFTCSTLSVHFSNKPSVILIGRILGGISNALINSIPESWLTTEIKNQKINKKYIKPIFSWIYFMDSIIAIIAGFIGSFLMKGESQSPIIIFNISSIITMIAIFFTILLWNENYGGSTSKKQSKTTKNKSKSKNDFIEVYQLIKKQPNIIIIGLISCLFEASMYLFILIWHPLLTSLCPSDSDSYSDNNNTTCPLESGLLYSAFMLCCMIGSKCSNTLIFGKKIKLSFILFLASISLGIISILVHYNDIQYNFIIISLLFCIYEICIGYYFPTISTIRSNIIPNNYKSMIMNILRIPLNFLVIIVFLNIKYLDNDGGLLCACIFIFISFILMKYFLKLKKE